METVNKIRATMLFNFFKIVFFMLVINPVFSQEGAPEKSYPVEKKSLEIKDSIQVPPNNHDKVIAGIESRISELEKKISQLESEAIARNLENQQSYLKELNELVVKKEELKVKISTLRARPEPEIEELITEVQKVLEELEKNYRVLLNEINKHKPGIR